MKIKLSDIIEKAKQRPANYYETVLSMGTVSGEVLEISVENYNKLLSLFNPAAKPVSQGCSSCGGHTVKPRKQPAMPSIGTSIRSLVNTTKDVVVDKVVKGKPFYVDEATKLERETVCSGCEFFNSEKQRCSRCGCWTSSKTKLTSAKCPVGKWLQNY